MAKLILYNRSSGMEEPVIEFEMDFKQIPGRYERMVIRAQEQEYTVEITAVVHRVTASAYGSGAKLKYQEYNPVEIYCLILQSALAPRLEAYGDW